MARPLLTICKFDIPESLLSRIDLARPDYLDRKSFVCCLIDKALTGSDTLVERAEELPEQGRSTVSEASSSKSSVSKSSLKPIAIGLEHFEDLIRDFWSVKGGSKGETAWKLLNTELLKIQKKYGDDVVSEQLQLAINGKFKGVTLTRYEQFKPKAAASEPPSRHPAHRDASEVIAEQERLAQQNIEHLRRKKQEEEEAGGLLADLGLSF